MLLNSLVSGAAVLRMAQRYEGVPATSAWQQLMDRYYPDIRCRFACGGRHVEIPAEDVCERTDVPFAPEWLEAVQETGLKEAA